MEICVAMRRHSRNTVKYKGNECDPGNPGSLRVPMLLAPKQSAAAELITNYLVTRRRRVALCAGTFSPKISTFPLRRLQYRYTEVSFRTRSPPLLLTLPVPAIRRTRSRRMQPSSVVGIDCALGLATRPRHRGIRASDWGAR
jgi:hypothetical protein